MCQKGKIKEGKNEADRPRYARQRLEATIEQLDVQRSEKKYTNQIRMDYFP